MSYQKRIEALIKLMQTSTSLFNNDDWIELKNLVKNLPSDTDSEDLWEAISGSNCLQRSEINDAIHQTPATPIQSMGELGPARSGPVPTPVQIPQTRDKLYNEIIRHQPDESSKESN